MGSGGLAWRQRSLLTSVVIIVVPFTLAFLVYRDFLELWFWIDDFLWLEAAANPDLSESVVDAFAFPRGATPYWRPLIDFHFLGMYHVFGLNGTAYHVTNLLLHASSAALLGFLALQLTRSGVVAALTAGLYVISPTYAAMVPWASGATALYAALFGVTTVLMFVYWLRRERSYWWLALPAATFAAALLAKEDAAALPGVLFLCAMFIRPPRRLRDLGALSLTLLPFLVIWFAYVVPQLLLVVGSSESPGYSFGWHVVPRTIDSLVWMSLPLHLSYAEWVSPARWAAFAAFTAITVLSGIRRQWQLPGLYAATVIMLLPSAFFTAPFVGRWTHLATMPWAMFLAYLIVCAYQLTSRLSRSVAIACGVAGVAWLLMFLSGRTIDAHARLPGFSRDYQAIETAVRANCDELRSEPIVYVVYATQIPTIESNYSVPALLRLTYSPEFVIQLNVEALSDASLPESSACVMSWSEELGYQATIMDLNNEAIAPR